MPAVEAVPTTTPTPANLTPEKPIEAVPAFPAVDDTANSVVSVVVHPLIAIAKLGFEQVGEVITRKLLFAKVMLWQVRLLNTIVP